jgi:hypothetical protein
MTPCTVCKGSGQKGYLIAISSTLKAIQTKVFRPVEVRGFEPLTPCMPSARDLFRSVRVSANRLQSLGFQFISVHQDSLEFISTAEVIAEVDPFAPCKESVAVRQFRGE